MTTELTGVRPVGGLLTPALLARVQQLDRGMPGMEPQDYGLGRTARVRSSVEASWQRLRGAWESFSDSRAEKQDGDRGTEAARKFLTRVAEELGYDGVQRSMPVSVDRRDFAVSHRWDSEIGQPIALHLLGSGLDLDRRNPGAAGAARQAPHAMVQQLLNASDDHLWAHLSNGLIWRLLRDNVAMSRQAFVEFDLAGIFDGEQYADFVVFWLTCHRTRVDAERPELCWLEKWAAQAEDDGSRALDRLRSGVEKALETLGTGFLSHRTNHDLRAMLTTDPDVGSASLDARMLWRQLLRLIYQLLFVLVAEERDVLLLREGDAKPAARQAYLDHYSLRRLRELSRIQAGSAHGDLWHQVRLVLRALGTSGEEALAVPPLGGQLFAPEVTGVLLDAELSNADLLQAFRHLCFVDTDGGGYAAVDYRNLGAEELGSVYEALLELHPRVDLTAKRFTVEEAAGNERKTTGAYYTPTQLIAQLCDTALEPVLAEAMKAENPESALLEVTVCDPSCGSGHFLVAAAQRIATRVAQVRAGALPVKGRVGDGEVTPEQISLAMRDVVSHCIYGVDVNPMAVELAKVSLWLEAHVPGQPLTFLDHHVKHGNSLLGTTPALVGRGIPDGAFKAIEGDDKKACTAYRKRNKTLREGQQSLLFSGDPVADHRALAAEVAELEAMEDHDLAELSVKIDRFAEVDGSERLQRQRLVADAWCAAFTAPKLADAAEAHPFELFYALRDGDQVEVAAVAAQAAQYDFFHWHLEFPHLYSPVEDPQEDDHLGWTGGFTVLLGNPPWEHTELKEKEWFGSRDDEIATASKGSTRKKLIKALAVENPTLHREYVHAKRQHDNWAHFARSGRFPLTGTGRINTYALFAEHFKDLPSESGRAGVIVPTGIATDHTTRHFFADLVDTERLASMFDFENRAGIFPAVDSRMKFALLTMAGIDSPIEKAEFAFFAHATTDLRDPERRFVLTPEDIALINPNTKTAPVFRTRRDAEITAKIYQNVPVLVREGDPDGNPWGVSFKQGLFNMTSDSDLFHTRDQLEADDWTLGGTPDQQAQEYIPSNVFTKGDARYLPLYEAKMADHLDHRAADVVLSATAKIRQGQPAGISVADHLEPTREPSPRFWVPKKEVDGALADRDNGWLLGWRRISITTNERTVLPSAFPRAGIGDSIFLMHPDSDGLPLLMALSSFCFDFVARQKMGGLNLSFFLMEQLPVPSPAGIVELGIGAAFVDDRGKELVFTSMGIGNDEIYRWDPARRELLRAELDAAMFHLYGLDRDEVDYIMGTFPIVKRKDEAEHGEYRTKRLILEIYDDLARCLETGEDYQTRLDPPPADPSLRIRRPERSP